MDTAAVIRGIFADAATGDLDRVMEWWADDGTLEDVTLASAFVGKAAIRDYLRMYFGALPELRYEPIRQIISGPTAMVEWIHTTPVLGEFDGVPGTGQLLTLHAIDVFHVENGLVQHEVSWYGDGWLRQRLEGTSGPEVPAPLPLTPPLAGPGARFLEGERP